MPNINLGDPSVSKPSAAMTVKGGSSSDSRGGSSRSYPKGSPPGNTDSAPFNPHNDPKSGGTKYVGGVG
jgi:hypothetical protein